MGGDSLRAVALVGDLRAAGFDVSVRDLFERRTPARLAALADERPAAEQAPPVAPFALLPAADVAGLPAGTADAYPLSQIQAGMVYQTLLHPERGYYHDVFGFVVRDDRPFDEDALRAAAAAAVRRHENLRTCVDLAAYSVPIQIVLNDAELPIEVEDLRGRTPEEIAAAVERRVAAERDRFFDLAAAPLMRLHVQIEADDRWRLWTTLHHVIIEGWSHHRLLMELLDDYRAAVRGLPPAPPPPPLRPPYGTPTSWPPNWPRSTRRRTGRTGRTCSAGTSAGPCRTTGATPPRPARSTGSTSTSSARTRGCCGWPRLPGCRSRACCSRRI
nr:hypothetical protein GCM10020093_033900 [Planobispora longispora]